ncbi:sodium:proton antiporter [Pseudomonas sp. OIL-1]|uniref:cation:proton antiporter n=1 Tax=Pseudomonas sp. OIL-1 TaxID=2706126 RepID=UPI0013A7300A|nr:cation:proton antiporter [Pseudomonas sp. OIL-1]QIB52262.1 sodium:proton antiporter [Pseudomonas sp. OIL-1]
MEQLNLSLAVMGATAVGVALMSSALKRSPVTESILAMAVGIAVGPYGLALLDLSKWGDETAILEQASRLTLAIGLMGVALRLKRESLRVLLKPIIVLLTIVMLAMWLTSSLLAGWLLGLPLWAALLFGAVVTPTDPVVASSIVTGKFAKTHLPLRIRDGLSLESGANDGLAYLFVMLPIFMMTLAPGAAWSTWLLESVLIGVVFAIVLGGVIGFSAARLLSLAEHHGWVDKTSLLGYTVAFSLFALGLAELLKADAVVSVFLAGLTFNLFSDKNDEHEEEKIQEGVAKLFTLPMFVIFGIALPFAAWAELGWPLLALTILILLLRRPPILLMLYPALRRYWTTPDVRFIGWFGPIGIAAIYYASLAHKHMDQPLFWHAGSAIIFASILVHGITAAPSTRLYARHAGVPPEGSRVLSRRDDE